MEADIRQLVQEIHDSPLRIVLVTAGAGTHALSWLLGVAGASRTLIEALIPYDAAASIDFLGQTPKQHVSDKVARLMAGRALTRARQLAQPEEQLVGLSCTATIITDRPKRGQHRAHIATWDQAKLTLYTLYLEKGARDREGEESCVSRVMLNALAAAYNISTLLETNLTENDSLNTKEWNFAATAQQLNEQTIPYFGVTDSGRIRLQNSSPQALLPGSFNPLHEGHIKLALASADILGHPVAFEMSAFNVDKPPLGAHKVLNRVAQFAGRWTLYMTNAPTFLEKARLFPGTIFVVGYDTAERILQPRYYHDSEAELAAALSEIRELDCRFLVAGRRNEYGDFNDASSLSVPSAFKELFDFIPSGRFRVDISSTELRQTGQRGAR